MVNGYPQNNMENAEGDKIIGIDHRLSVDLLKVMASVFIVNSHFGSVWPVGQLAFGGLIGDCLFFMASGYCLYGILIGMEYRFPRWYLERIIRVYPAVWISICVGLIIGLYRFGSFSDVFSIFIYPTPFHFVGSIMICYIVYYFAVTLCKKKGCSLLWIIIGVFGLHLLIYIFLYDKSYYHVDVVEENFIRFLYLESMMTGAVLKASDTIVAKVRNLHPVIKWGGVLFFGCIYLATKQLFSHYSGFETVSNFQIINQVTISIFVSFLFAVVLGEEDRIRKFSRPIIMAIYRIAALTLEIYVFHHYFIMLFGKMIFPVNVLLIVTSTLAAAFGIHKVLEKPTRYVNHFIETQSFRQ